MPDQDIVKTGRAIGWMDPTPGRKHYRRKEENRLHGGR